MAYKFNPLIGVGLDEVGTGGGGSTNPGGSDTQVQFNDGGSTFGGDDGLTFNKTTNELTIGADTSDGGSAKVYGDINLDDGGASTTTVQCVTPTANRTISFPNATGTVALVAGSNQAVQYNSAGTNAGDSGLLYDATSGSLTVGGKTVTTSAPVINLSQTWNSAGTTFTGLKLNVTNTASASTSNLLDLQVGGTSKHKIDADGNIYTTRIIATGGEPVYYTGILFSSGNVSLRASNVNVATFGRDGNNCTIGLSGDVSLAVEGPDTFAQRRGTNAQTFRLYNTWANNGVDFERTSLTRDSSGLVIDAQKGGTGADPTNLLDLKLGGTSKCLITKDGYITSGAALKVISDTEVQFRSIAQATWSSSSIGGTSDVGLVRAGVAGVIKVTDGSTGDGTISGQLRAVGTAPASSGAAGTAGDIRYDSNYIYVCTATDTWARAALTPGPW